MASSSSSSSSTSDEIAFFDVETTVPSRRGQGYSLLEFAAVLVCPRRLLQLSHFSTLIRPRDLSSVSPASIRCNGITREQVEAAPAFSDVADRIYDILHGRVWAGHNIVMFDCPRVREAFAEIGRPPPEPKGLIDSYPLLTKRFGRRAGNMKMATLASYFGLGQQTHRSLDDVRMNIEVLKYCATVLFLESVSMEPLPMSTWVSPRLNDAGDDATSLGKSSSHPNPVSYQMVDNEDNMSTLGGGTRIDVRSRIDVQDIAGPSTKAPLAEQVSLEPLIEQMRRNSMLTDDKPDTSLTIENLSLSSGYLDPDKVSSSLIHVTSVPASQYGSKMVLLYGNDPLQFFCMGLRVHFGLSRKFVDHAGRPKLSIVLDAPDTLRQLLDFCDSTAQRSFSNLGSTSEWRPFVKRSVYPNYHTIRLKIPTMAVDAATICMAEIYQRETIGNNHRLVPRNFDSPELDSLFVPGAIVDAYFSVDIYDYQQFAGISLTAKRLVVHSHAKVC